MTFMQWLGVALAVSPVIVVLVVMAREGGPTYAAIALFLALATVGAVAFGTHLIRTGGAS